MTPKVYKRALELKGMGDAQLIYCYMSHLVMCKIFPYPYFPVYLCIHSDKCDMQF